ncbi:hypothetical protein Vretimale_18174 [Volvox reticuliferus]|nr:hypothetical protein Vretimale_18174 [Volvox reticuliferus]
MYHKEVSRSDASWVTLGKGPGAAIGSGYVKDDNPRASFTKAALTRCASIKRQFVCPGVRGDAYEHLYGCMPQGVLHASDITAGCAGDGCLESEHAALKEAAQQGFPAFYGAADSMTDDDDMAIGRGMLVGTTSDDGGEDAEEHGEPSGTLTKGKKRSVRRGQMTRLLAAILEFCRLVNAFIARQPRDRVNGRFWSTSEEFREALNMLTSADQDHLSDGDCVAVVEAERGRSMVRVGFVERLLAPQSRTRAKQALRRIRRLDINNPNGCLRLRMLTPAGKDENGRLQYLMPHALAHCANTLWETRSIVQLVYMKPGRDDPTGGHYIMHVDDEKALRGYCVAHRLVLDEKGVGRGRGASVDTAIVVGTVHDKGTGMALSAPKPAQPRQRKLEMRVDPAAHHDVAAALGQQTKSGRKVHHTKKALGED